MYVYKGGKKRKRPYRDSRKMKKKSPRKGKRNARIHLLILTLWSETEERLDPRIMLPTPYWSEIYSFPYKRAAWERGTASLLCLSPFKCHCTAAQHVNLLKIARERPSELTMSSWGVQDPAEDSPPHNVLVSATHQAFNIDSWRQSSLTRWVWKPDWWLDNQMHDSCHLLHIREY